ncbi:MAG: hypothetical protein ACOZNI_14165 [Myxococcota bacterium]
MILALLACADAPSPVFDLRGIEPPLRRRGGDPAGDDTGDDPFTEPVAERGGPVRLDGHVLSDDGGPFLALGATMMWAPYGYKHERALLEQDLATLRDGGFHYVRALGLVGDPDGEDSWDGREIDLDWSDYDEVIAGFTDLAWDGYGLRVEWTLIGDGQVSIPEEADRYALVDRFLAMSQGREEKIQHFEIANEAWQNGFDGDEGLAQLRDLTAYMQARTDILVAASAPWANDCDVYDEVYGGGVGDVATLHFDRDNSSVEGGWMPVRRPWDVEGCAGLQVATNNEPIGPGSSVTTEEDPDELGAAAVATWISGLPMHVFHSGAGVRGWDRIADMSGHDAYRHLATLLPGDLPGWDRHEPGDADAPFAIYAESADGSRVEGAVWPNLSAPAAGAVRVFSATQDDAFVVFPFGVLDHVDLAARRDLTFVAHDPITGAEVLAGELAAGEEIRLEGYEAFVVRGVSPPR